MLAVVFMLVLAVALIILGITNIRDNINSIHSYHRHIVSKDDIPVFGRLMGIGIIVCDVGIILYYLFFVIGEFVKQTTFIYIGSFLMVLMLIVGIVIMTYITIKYNKVVFDISK